MIVSAALEEGELPPPISAAAAKRFRIAGCAEIGLERGDGRTRLSHLYQHDPLRVLFPRAEPGEPLTAALVTTSGGLVAGDRLDISFAAGPGAEALLTTQAAEKVYRSTGADCTIALDLRIDSGARLEWLPQETILFDGARLRRRTAIDFAADGTVMAGEIVVFGRHAMGETVCRGLVRDAWELRRDGRLVWAEALHLEGALDDALADPAGFDGARAMATMVYAAADAPGRIGCARALLEAAGAEAAATCLDGVLIVRWLDRDAQRLRRNYGDFRAAFRAAVAGLPARLPRLWAV
ncbi:MAG: urease accessory protein UreD [Alphaproteobacteria bacterium]|jgi:urease accessory protein|nr:urease accessory protein UreD [Alphaproteobacteria bacterium]